MPPWELGKGDDCLDPLRPQFLSSWGPSVYAYLLLPPPKKSEESCGRQNNVRPPSLPKMTTSSSLEPVNVLVYVVWQGEINVVNGVQVANQMIP